MPDFICNICGSRNSPQIVEWEAPSCSVCASNIRLRAIVFMLSRELFGRPLPLPDFPAIGNIKGLGLSDHPCYATPLAEKFNYTNTFYDSEPRLDIMACHPELYGTYDFLLASDVLEHVPIPLDRSLDEACKLLQPNGFLCITVPSSLDDDTVEHYPDLYKHSLATLGDERVLVNRRRDGGIEVHENLIFHGGPGSTLEMRLISEKDLRRRLQTAGFAEVTREDAGAEEFGIVYADEWSRPMVARKGKFVLPPLREHNRPYELQIAKLSSRIDELEIELTTVRDRLSSRVNELETELAAVRDSRWVKLGNRLGLGPRVSSL